MANTKGYSFGIGALSMGVGAAAISATTNVNREAYMTPRNMAAPPHTSPATVYVDQGLLTAKLEAVEARTETKFAQLIGKIDLLGQSLSSLNEKVAGVETKVSTVDGHVRSAKATIIGAVLATGISIAGLAYGAVQIFEAALTIK